MARMRWLLTAIIVVFGMSRFVSAREVDPKTAARSAAQAESNCINLFWQRLPPLLRGALYTFAERYERGIAICDEVLKTDPNNTRAYELRGWAYLFQRNHSRQAIADFSEALRHEPGNTAILIARSRAYRQDKNYDRAIADCTEAIRLEPRCAEAYARRASNYRTKKVITKAIAEFTAALKLDPGLLWARCDRGEAYWMRGETERTLADLEEILRREPYNELARFNRCNIYLSTLCDFDRVIAETSELIDLSPQEPKWYLLRGMAYLFKGEITKGLRDETTATRLDPQEFKWRYRRKSGSLVFYVGANVGEGAFPGEDDTDERIEACTKRLGSDPNNVAIYYERACAFLRKREYKPAIADLDEIIRRDPGDAVAYFDRGFAYLRLKEYAKAVADYTKAIRTDPNCADYHFARANVYVAQGRHEKALRDSARALLLDPQITAAHNLRGWLYEKRKDDSAALADYSEALRLSPTKTYAYERRASIYAEQGKYAEAFAGYKKVLQLDPQNIEAHGGLGWYLAICPDAKLRNGKEAREHATTACEESKWREPNYLDTLAAACAECGDFESAVKWQSKALELAAESNKVYYQRRLELYQSHKPYHLSSRPLSALPSSQ